jgi:ABC-type molybdate transport system substrate-binding protein
VSLQLFNLFEGNIRNQVKYLRNTNICYDIYELKLMINQEIKKRLLALLEEGTHEFVIEYVAGKYDNDPEMKSIVEDIIIDSPEVQKFYKDYTAVLDSKTDKEWKEDAEKSLKRIKARMGIS